MDGGRDAHGLKQAAVTVSAEALDRACHQFHRDAPTRSARRVLTWAQAALMCVIGYGLYHAFDANAALTGAIALWTVYALFAASTAWRLYAAANLQPVLSRLQEPAPGAVTLLLRAASALSGDLSHVRAAPTMPLYWPLSTLAAIGAVFDLAVRPHYWAKTTHGVSARARLPFESRAPRTDEAAAALSKSA